jgi:carbon-monoxide dehydrogenase large subunit
VVRRRSDGATLATVDTLAAQALAGSADATTALSTEATFSNDNKLTYTAGVQIAHVAVDRETATVEVLRLLTVEDIGRVINPAIVHGQTIGAAVQGMGGTFLDEFVYDETGQLLTGSFADYLLPTSTDFPNVEAITLENARSPSNPLGAKGAGEGGIIATGAALSNAVSAALASLGVSVRALPLSPNNLARLIREAHARTQSTFNNS